MASGGEIQETAIGDQGTRLDLQLLDQDCVKQILENEDSQPNLGGLRKSNLEEVASARDKCEAPVRQSRAAGERDCSNSRG